MSNQPKKRGRPKGSKNRVEKEIGEEVVTETKRERSKRPIQHQVVYRYRQGLSIPLGYYIDKLYTTRNRAKTRIKNLKKMSLAKLAKEFDISPQQAETIQFKIYSYRKPKPREYQKTTQEK